MREIKFRVWDTYFEKMETNQHTILALMDWVNQGDKTRFTIMQFTGLKDKDGREIFEGDIVKWFADSKIKTDKVGFFDGSFCLMTYFFEPLSFKSFCEMDSLEVIGNIFENPELLKEVRE